MNLPLLSSILLFITVASSASAYNSFIQHCRDAPTPARKMLCEQLQRMDNMAREKQAVVPPAIVLHPAYDCRTLVCLCPYFHGVIADDGTTCISKGEKRLERAIRKEIRHFSDEERERFHRAMNNLKRSGEYQRLATVHPLASQQGGVHTGPAFLIWHREYLKRIEIAVRLLDPDLALPYWDSLLDQNLPDARDSILWTPDFYGESDSRGHVKNGPFVNWTTLEGHPQIHRDLGGRATLFTDAHLRIIQEHPSIAQIMAYTAPREGCPVQPVWDNFEYVHGNPHVWIGGDMLNTETSTNDPVFFQHHAFVDLIWEQWRQTHQNRSSRETEYPENSEDCSNIQHFSTAEMYPFAGMRNIDGLSNQYTDIMYTFAPRPSCSTSNPDCASPYLFCDVAHKPPRCISKAREGGRCDGFEETDICYNGRCRNGRCVSFDDGHSSEVSQPRQFQAVASDAGKRSYRNSKSVISTILSITAGLGLVAVILWAILPVVKSPFSEKATFIPLMDKLKEKFNKSSILKKWRQGDECENSKKYGSIIEIM